MRLTLDFDKINREYNREFNLLGRPPMPKEINDLSN